MPQAELDSPAIAKALIREFVSGLGDLGGRTLAELSGQPAEIDRTTGRTLRATTAWNTLLGAMTCEQLLTLVGQEMGLKRLSPLACWIASRHPNATVSFYPGDLTHAILRTFPIVFEADPAGARAVLAADRSWLRRLIEVDVEFHTTIASEVSQLLDEATMFAITAGSD